MVRLDRENFEHKRQLGFGKILVFFGEIAAVCVVVVGDLSQGILDLLEAV